jgi:hypothetical protein
VSTAHDYTLERGESWDRLIIVKDRRTHRPLKVTACQGYMRNGALTQTLNAQVSSEHGVYLTLDEFETWALLDGEYPYDVVATIAAEDRIVQSGTIKVASVSQISPRGAAEQMSGDPMAALMSTTTTTPALTAEGYPLWQQTPTRVDLAFWQGDDVVIPLFFNDPDIPDDDMSDYDWHAEIRVYHGFDSTLVGEFAVAATFITGTDEATEHTKVELLLPRQFNTRAGTFRWEVYAVGDSDLSRFPKPASVDAADWPPPDVLRTMLFGYCTVLPRVSATDVLPPPAPGALMLGNGGMPV